MKKADRVAELEATSRDQAKRIAELEDALRVTKERLAFYAGLVGAQLASGGAPTRRDQDREISANRTLLGLPAEVVRFEPTREERRAMIAAGAMKVTIPEDE